MKKRTFIQATAWTLLSAGFTTVQAQMRGKVTQLIVPFAPGGSGDILARLLAQFMQDKYGRTSVVDLKPGANGIIGMEAAKMAPADGRTLVVASTSTFSANPSLFKKLPYDPEKDFTLVGVLGTGGSYLLVRPDAPFKTVAELIAHAKSAPGQLNYGHFNASSQIPGALLANRAGIDIRPVPYKQVGTAITDLIGGQIQMVFVDTTAGDNYVTSGQLRPLGVTQTKRLARHPAVPAISETIPGFEVISFIGIAVAAATPEPTKEELNRIIVEAVKSEPLRGKLEGFGFVPYTQNLRECVAFGRAQRARWQEYIAAANIPAQ